MGHEFLQEQDKQDQHGEAVWVMGPHERKISQAGKIRENDFYQMKGPLMRNNFSLRESIVICVVFIMAGIMITAAAVRTAADKAQECLTHLKKIGMAQMMYASEYDDHLARNIFDLNTYLGFRAWDIPDVTGCPAVEPERKRKVFYGFEYGKNAYILCPKKILSSNSDSEDARNNMGLYTMPDKTMFYMDFPTQPNGGLGAVFISSPWINAKDPQAFRHEMKSNTLYIDGHATPLAPEEIPADNRSPFWSM